jgi:hypothetical protein
VKLKAVLLACAIGGCASPTRGNNDGNGGGGGDMSFQGFPDMVESGDLKGSGGNDLANKPDLLTAFDLGTTPSDMTATPSDMTAAPADMTVTPADMTTSNPDMTGGSCTPPVVGGQCDTWPQCGCSGTLACTVTDTTSGLTGCVSSGSTVAYGTCTGTGSGQCKPGFTCVDRVCKQYCNGHSDCGGTYRMCDQVSVGGTPVPQMYTCSRLCDPVNPQLDDATYDACGPGANCLPASNRVSDCIGGITALGTQGSDCSIPPFGGPDIFKCAPGFICLSEDPFGFTGTCFKFCHNPAAGTSVECGGGLRCWDFATTQYAGNTPIGYCDTP